MALRHKEVDLLVKILFSILFASLIAILYQIRSVGLMAWVMIGLMVYALSMVWQAKHISPDLVPYKHETRVKFWTLFAIVIIVWIYIWWGTFKLI
jgi:hypothetical protein